MPDALTDLDRRLLGALQRGVPLLPRPFEQLAAELGTTEADAVARVEALSGPGEIIREIAGVFDAAALGYRTTLVAAGVPAGGLDRAGEAVAAHPGVSHCYARAGELNLWFTLSVAPETALGLDGTVEVLRRLAGAERALSLPAVRRYKLHVRFDLGAEDGSARPEPADFGGAGIRPAEPTPAQVCAIRALQAPLPAVAEPFARLGSAAGLSADDLLVHAADFLAAGWMRRYAAVLRHRRAGAACNVLVAWRVPLL